MSPTIQQAYNDTVLKFKALYPDEEACAIADRLFEHYFNLTPVQRVLSGKAKADKNEMSLTDEAAKLILDHVPLQYVIGFAYFLDMEFHVNSSVLIPRPETEELVSLIVKDSIASQKDQFLKIIDIGTGSGCIAISLSRLIPSSVVTALDISCDAIEVAKSNAVNNNAEVNFVCADILDPSGWDALPQADIIVSNPPYIKESEKTLMLPNVINYEPHKALFVPDEDPLRFYRSILTFAKIKLTNSGSLWFEINEMFGEELKDLAKSQGFMEVNIFFDIRGKSRFLHAVK